MYQTATTIINYEKKNPLTFFVAKLKQNLLAFNTLQDGHHLSTNFSHNCSLSQQSIVSSSFHYCVLLKIKV